MKDVELVARLRALGMDQSKAEQVTREVRDLLHPVATIAAVKLADHREALGAFQCYGDAGLAGYEFDELSGLLSKVKKAAKKAVKKVGKVAGKVAPILAVVPGMQLVAAGAMAAGAVTKGKSPTSSKYMKSDKDAGKVAYQTMTPQQLADEKLRLQTKIDAGKDVKTGRKKLANVQSLLNVYGEPAPSVAQPAVTSSPKTPPQANMSERIARGGRVRVPRDLSVMAGQVASEAQAGNYAADPAQLLQAMLANQGTNMVSAPATEIIREVAAQGVEQTPEGPSPLPAWAIPAALAAGVGLLFVAMAGRRRA